MNRQMIETVHVDKHHDSGEMFVDRFNEDLPSGLVLADETVVKVPPSAPE